MPIFEYVCQECKKRFETLVYGSQKAKCARCGSNKLDPQLSVFARVREEQFCFRQLRGPLRYLWRSARRGCLRCA